MKAMKNLWILITLVVITVGVFSSEGKDIVLEPQVEHGMNDEGSMANIIYSDWIPSEFDDDITGTMSSFTIHVPDMTEEFINSGLILVYARTKSNTLAEDYTVYGLPIIFWISRQHSYYFRVDKAEELEIIVGSDQPGKSVGTTIFTEYRYVLIPEVPENSGKIGGIASKTPEEYKSMSHKEIATLFNIPQ